MTICGYDDDSLSKMKVSIILTVIESFNALEVRIIPSMNRNIFAQINQQQWSILVNSVASQKGYGSYYHII